MLPVRSDLSVATSALLLVIPVVVGTAAGGFAVGLLMTGLGFLVYDFIFIPPYYTLAVGAAENWVALGVYALVMLVISRLVSRLVASERAAQLRSVEVRQLFNSADLLVRESNLDQLVQATGDAMSQLFGVTGVALLLSDSNQLTLAATAGAGLDDLDPNDLARWVSADHADGTRRSLVLISDGKPVGVLVMANLGGSESSRDLLMAFGNHLALAVERRLLQERAMSAKVLAEVDQIRRSMVGAVSHDLRSPLTTILVAASSLRESSERLSAPDRRELAGLIEQQARRLDQLVANLLDMTRIQSGRLELQPLTCPPNELVYEAVSCLRGQQELDRLVLDLDPELPEVRVDPILGRQTLANLVDNALRYSPELKPVRIGARLDGSRVVVTVEDEGGGIPESDRESAFNMFNSRPSGGRGGLGLAIAAAFVKAHGQAIWVEDRVENGKTIGSRVCFSLGLA